MIPATLASFLLPFISGCALIQVFCPTRAGRGRWLPLKGSLGLGYGLGLSSSLFFLWLTLFGPAARGLAVVEVVVCVGLVLLCLARRDRREPNQVFTIVSDSLLIRVLRVCFWTLFASALVSFAILSLDNPHGTVDAWGMWNMRARYMFRAGGEYWLRALSPHLTSPDHPLLLPGLVARSWRYAGQEIPAVPILAAMFFLVGSVELLVSSVSILKGRARGYLSGLVLLGTPFFIQHAASQYADVPLAFYFLATISLFCLHDHLREPGRPLLLLAGAAAGLSAWTKDEGLLFIAAILIARFIAVFPSGGMRLYLRQTAAFLTGLLPLAALIVYFKVFRAPSNYIFAPLSMSATLERLTDVGRYLLICKVAGSVFWEYFAIPVCVLVIYALLSMRNSAEGVKELRTTVTATLFVMLLGYFLIYVITPVDLALHTGTSLHRLLLQLWPTFLFACFTATRGPIEADGAESLPK